MVHHKRGNGAEAQKWLAEAVKWVEGVKEKQTGEYVNIAPTDWQEFHVLRAEADSLIGIQAQPQQEDDQQR